MRTWLMRLAPVVLALLQLAVPRGVAAAELELCRDAVRAAPRHEALPKPVLAGAELRAAGERLSDLTPLVAASNAAASLQHHFACCVERADAQQHSSSIAARLPRSRAPPTQS